MSVLHLKGYGTYLRKGLIFKAQTRLDLFIITHSSSSSTAPCAPQALTLTPQCDTQVVLVTWAPSNLAKSYYLTANGLDGDLQNCSSTLLNCTLSRLNCGQQYTLGLTALDGNCTSPVSQALTLRTSETQIIKLFNTIHNVHNDLRDRSHKRNRQYVR